MADQDFHLQLAKGTRPWRVRSYGVGLHPPVKADSLPVDFKTNPARPTFQNNPSSYKCRKFSSLDERVQNFKGFKYEKVNYLKNFLEEERPANRDITAKAQIMKREIQERSRKTRNVQIVKDQNQKSKAKASNSTASQSPREGTCECRSPSSRRASCPLGSIASLSWPCETERRDAES